MKLNSYMHARLSEGIRSRLNTFIAETVFVNMAGNSTPRLNAIGLTIWYSVTTMRTFWLDTTWLTVRLFVVPLSETWQQ